MASTGNNIKTAAVAWTASQLAAAFWQFSLAFYPSRQPLLLRLQDEHQANINVLLAICWLSLQQRQLTSPQLRQILSALEPVNQQVTTPLRQIRRNLQADTLQFKPALLAVELQAEQAEQQAIAEVLAKCWYQLESLSSAHTALQAYCALCQTDLSSLPSLLVDLDQAISGYTPSLGETLI